MNFFAICGLFATCVYIILLSMVVYERIDNILTNPAKFNRLYNRVNARNLIGGEPKVDAIKLIKYCEIAKKAVCIITSVLIIVILFIMSYIVRVTSTLYSF